MDYPETNLEKKDLILKRSTIIATNSSFILDKNTSIISTNEETFIAIEKHLSGKNYIKATPVPLRML